MNITKTLKTKIMNEVVEIELYGIKLRVYGDYTKGEGQEWGYPGSCDEFEIEEIHHNNENIYDIIDPKDIETIQEKAIEQIKSY